MASELRAQASEVGWPSDSQVAVSLPPRGDLSLSETFWYHSWREATGILRVEAREAAKHSPMPRTAPTAENYLAPNVSSAETGRPVLRTKRLRPSQTRMLKP